MDELQPIPKIKTIDVMKHDIEIRAKALMDFYEEIKKQKKIPKEFESDQIKARKKRVAKQSAINEAQMDLFGKP